MSVNFVLVGGVEHKAAKAYEETLNNGTRPLTKDEIATEMYKGNFAEVGENLFNSDVFKNIFGTSDTSNMSYK